MDDIQNPADPVGDEAVRADHQRVTESATKDAPKKDDTFEPRAADDEAAPASDDDGDPEKAESRSQERRRKRRAQMDAIRKEADQKAAEARQATEALEKIRKAGEAKKPPQQNEFDNYDDYIAARAVFEAGQAMSGAQQEQITEQVAAAERAMKVARDRAAAEARALYADAAIEARAKFADFDAVIAEGGVYVSPEIADMIVASDSPAELAYTVAKDPTLAARLSAMPLIEAARELGRVEARMTAPKPRIETKAPDPISPVKGKAGAARDPEKMSFAEYAAARRSGQIR